MRVGFNWKEYFSRINGYVANGAKVAFKIVEGVIYFVGCKHATCWEITRPKQRAERAGTSLVLKRGTIEGDTRKSLQNTTLFCKWDAREMIDNFALFCLFGRFAFLACRRYLNSDNMFAKQRWNAGSQPSTDSELDLDFLTTWLVNWTVDFSKG